MAGTLYDPDPDAGSDTGEGRGSGGHSGSSIPRLGSGRASDVHRAKPSLVLLAGGAALLLALVGGIVAVSIYIATGGEAFRRSAPPAPLRASASGLGSLRTRAGAVVVFADVRNDGKANLGGLVAKLTATDAAGAELATGVCSPALRLLAPGEKVPCSFPLGTIPAWKDVQITVDARPVEGTVTRALLNPSAPVLVRGPAGVEVSVSVRDESAFAARHVVYFVRLLAGGKLVGAAELPGKDVDAGATVTVSLPVADAASPPDAAEVLAFGYRD